jgi:hypothetical protein
MDTLYNYVSKDALPKDFGGSLDSLAAYQSKCKGLFRDMRQEFTFMP